MAQRTPPADLPRAMESIAKWGFVFAEHPVTEMTPKTMGDLLRILRHLCRDRTFRFPSDMVVHFAELADFMASEMMKQDALKRTSV